MEKKLAIKGHVSRGKEIIELFKMMGGCECGYSGGVMDCYYYISQFGNIEASYKPYEFDTYIVYTLEEFLEKYPFKVGDKVYIYIQNDDIDGRYDIEVVEITSMRWNPARCKIAYKMKDINREFYKEEIKCKVDDDSNKTIKDMGKKLAIKGYPTRVEYEIIDGYEFDKVENNKIILKPIKSKYPTTYEECYDEGNTELHFIYVDKDERDLYESFIQLIRCRNAYWKIAGEKMGLDKPWEPAIQDTIWGITRSKDEVEKYSCHYGKTNLLEFPSEEMRDAFYENFKDLIEQCKELL